MKKVEFTQNWQNIFSQQGLIAFSDFFEKINGKIVNKNNKRDVILFEMQVGSQSREFFIKRFHRPHFKDQIFALQNLNRPASIGRLEWENARLLLQNDIQTYRPVCFGEHKTLGLEKRSFIITEKLTGRCLTEFIRDNWQQLSTNQRQKLVFALGRFVGKIHKSQISLPDLYLYHFFVEIKNDDFQFAVIDLHRMQRNATATNQRANNLAALKFTMRKNYFTDELLSDFLAGYKAQNTDVNIDMLMAKADKRIKKLSKRRTVPNY